jgi:hypothetical protein
MLTGKKMLGKESDMGINQKELLNDGAAAPLRADLRQRQ